MKKTILFIGDSYINAIGDKTLMGWAGHIIKSLYTQADSQWVAYTLGVGGNSSADIAARWEQEAKHRLSATSGPCKLVFAFGVNDAALDQHKKTRLSLQETHFHAQTIFSKALTYGQVLSIGPAPVLPARRNPEAIAHIDHILQDVCHQYSLPYISLLEPLSHSSQWHDNLQQNDGLHPDATGYKIIADLIAHHPTWKRYLNR